MNTTTIFSLDYEGRGIARVDGKTIFISNALPQETVQFRLTQDKGRFALAVAEKIICPSPYRQSPPCPNFYECGGCSMQHIEFSAQVSIKQRVFEEQLQRIGKVRPETILPPIYGIKWHYRSRTRLNISINTKNILHLGYQAHHSNHIISLNECHVLPEHVSGSLKILRNALQTLHEQMPKIHLQHVEISVGANATAVCIASDKTLPERFWRNLQHNLHGTTWQFWQRVNAREAECVLPKNAPKLHYTLPEFGLTLPFRIGDFTQINTAMNEVMVRRALHWLAPQPNENIADFFCGLGNFTLPIARSGATVLGVEGADFLTQRATQNAHINGLHNARFYTANLFDITPQMLKKLGYFDKILLDPPRAGAFALVKALHAPFLPKRIVYVSCNPATLARDAAVLVNKGYRFSAAGVMNLFSHTSHVEAMAIFDAT